MTDNLFLVCFFFLKKNIKKKFSLILFVSHVKSSVFLTAGYTERDTNEMISSQSKESFIAIVKHAIKNSLHDVIEKIVNEKYQLESIDTSELINICIEHSDMKMMKILMKIKDIEVNRYSFSKRTFPLRVAVTNGMKDFVDILLENKNININQTSSWGDPVAFEALKLKDVYIFEKLISHPHFMWDSHVDVEGNTLLHEIFHKNLLGHLKLMIEYFPIHDLINTKNRIGIMPSQLMLNSLHTNYQFVDFVLKMDCVELNPSGKKGTVFNYITQSHVCCQNIQEKSEIIELILKSPKIKIHEKIIQSTETYSKPYFKFSPIKSTILLFMNSPLEMINIIRAKHQDHVFIYLMMIFLADGYMNIRKTSQSKHQNTLKFFNITQSLPLEIKAIISSFVYDNKSKGIITSSMINNKIKDFIYLFYSNSQKSLSKSHN